MIFTSCCTEILHSQKPDKKNLWRHAQTKLYRNDDETVVTHSVTPNSYGDEYVQYIYITYNYFITVLQKLISETTWFGNTSWLIFVVVCVVWHDCWTRFQYFCMYDIKNVVSNQAYNILLYMFILYYSILYLLCSTILYCVIVYFAFCFNLMFSTIIYRQVSYHMSRNKI